MPRCLRGVLATTALVAVAVLVVGASSGAFAQVSRENTLTGQIRPPGTRDFAIAANSVGDLPGVLELRVSLVGTSVVDGDWTLFVQEPGADGAVTARGIVSGQVMTGIATLSSGSVTALRNVQLSVDSGTDEYVGATGTGAFEATVMADAPMPLTGNLSLVF